MNSIETNELAIKVVQAAALAAVVSIDTDDLALAVARYGGIGAGGDAAAAPADTDDLQRLVTGARRLSDVAHTVEIVAALLARERGATVRQLAQVAGISERAANDRYRRRATEEAPKATASQPRATNRGRAVDGS